METSKKSKMVDWEVGAKFCRRQFTLRVQPACRGSTIIGYLKSGRYRPKLVGGISRALHRQRGLTANTPDPLLRVTLA
ncbi:MAG: hypothetical protein GPOALKHO_000807 [Sodalis sp.]|nr:MAG: hypothetical protein GPOALKHO_000807 [Sodalis sp.]